GGDVLSDLVQAHGLGLLVGEKEKTAVAEALITLLQKSKRGVFDRCFLWVHRITYWSALSSIPKAARSFTS
ncbi:MAG: hypothetical protein AAF353_16510, partial [Pseudomonadota bacterium]